MQRFRVWLLRHPIICIVATLLLTALLGSYALRIRIDSSIENILPAGDPQVRFYDDVRRTFGGDDVGVIGVRANDLFAQATLEKIARITDAVAKLEGVERVLSLTNTVDPAADVFHPPPLLTLPASAAQIAALKDKLRATPLYGKNLVADDFTGAAINVFFKSMTDAEYVDLGIDAKIEAILGAEKGSLYYTGAAHVKQAAVEMMRDDLRRFTPLAMGLVLAVLWFSFWTAAGVVLPLLSVLMAVVWTLGIMVLAGKSITLGTFILPPLLIVVGSSFGTHVMARYYEQVHGGAPADQWVTRALERVSLPLTVSALTMVIGFAALMVNRITAIRDLGLFACVGVVCLTVSSLTLIPAVLQLLRQGRGRRGRGRAQTARLWEVLIRLGEKTHDWRAAVLAVGVLMALASLPGIAKIRVDSDFLYYFDPSSPVRRDNETINQDIVGSNPFFLVVEGREAGALKRWENLRLIRELQKFVAGLDGITASVSVVDYLELLEAGLKHGGEADIVVNERGEVVEPAGQKTFWEDPSALAPVLAVVDSSGDTFKSVVTSDFRRANILVRTKLSGSRRIEAVLQQVRGFIDQHFPKDLKVTPSGNLVLLTGTASDIVTGQIQSLALALVVSFVVMALMFLSIKVGALVILPNVLPILMFFGVMGWFGVLLNLGTSLIAAIALGIAVDSTVHYMARLNQELRGETQQRAAQVRALRSVGPPIIYATVALGLGFLTFAFSGFVPIQSFGILTAITMVTALAANLVLLPAVLATTEIITLWDLVGVTLGQDPTRTIPLFAGLRAGQARLVVLMGKLRSFSAGEVIVRKGEVGGEMFVIVRGEADVVAGSEAHRRAVMHLKRGDVFGEMALVRHHTRSADVVATDDVEALAIDEHFLERLQRRYPRIAAKVLLNITKIVSDRLQRMTDKYVGETGV